MNVSIRPNLKLLLFGCSLSIAALFSAPFIPRAISQESQRSGTPLKDVCQDGWTRYECATGARLCVPPDLESQYDLANSEEWSEGNCSVDKTMVPEAWSHATPEQVGYSVASLSRWQGYDFRAGVVNLHVSMIDSSIFKRKFYNDEELNRKKNMEDAFSRLQSIILNQSDLARREQGMDAYKAQVDVSLEQYKIPHTLAKTAVTDVCPAQWSRFSCQFVRLCVSPNVSSTYDLSTSKEFGYAKCKADDRSVPEGDTHFSPHDVGEGALLINRVYFKAVKLDSSDIFQGDIEEAIERLVLVPIPTSGLMDYDRGYEVGQARFLSSVAKAHQKEKQSEDAKGPH